MHLQTGQKDPTFYSKLIKWQLFSRTLLIIFPPFLISLASFLTHEAPEPAADVRA